MLTVLFATRNRAGILRQVLESFCQLEMLPADFRIVAVDNGSTDGTAQVIASFQCRLPLHYVYEERPGKSNALNAGLQFVIGDLVVFTDDDVFPQRNWLSRLRRAADSRPEYCMFGGVTIARWPTCSPQWAHWGELGAAFTVSSPLAKEGPVLRSQLAGVIVGPNMAVRASVFQCGVRFDPSIGPNGGDYAMGCESELLLRLSAQGHRAYHVHDAVVEHLVREEQLEKAWVLQRAIRFGRGLQRQSPDVKAWAGVPRHLFRDIPKQAVLVAAAGLFLRKEALFRARWFLNIHWGRAIEALAMARARSGSTCISSVGEDRQIAP